MVDGGTGITGEGAAKAHKKILGRHEFCAVSQGRWGLGVAHGVHCVGLQGPSSTQQLPEQALEIRQDQGCIRSGLGRQKEREKQFSGDLKKNTILKKRGREYKK